MDTAFATPKTPKNLSYKSPKTPRSGGDRFIPTRSAMNLDISHFNLTKENKLNSSKFFSDSVI